MSCHVPISDNSLHHNDTMDHLSGVAQRLRTNASSTGRPCLCAFDVDRTLTGYQEPWPGKSYIAAAYFFQSKLVDLSILITLRCSSCARARMLSIRKLAGPIWFTILFSLNLSLHSCNSSHVFAYAPEQVLR